MSENKRMQCISNLLRMHLNIQIHSGEVWGQHQGTDSDLFSWICFKTVILGWRVHIKQFGEAECVLLLYSCELTL